jgi:hypothetical protein
MLDKLVIILFGREYSSVLNEFVFDFYFLHFQIIAINYHYTYAMCQKATYKYGCMSCDLKQSQTRSI